VLAGTQVTQTQPGTSQAVEIVCADGVRLGGDFWPAQGNPKGGVIVNPATGVLARYYHRYARYLTEHGYDVLTYDYRGIGASRPASLRGCGYRWRDWGMLDFNAAVKWMKARSPDAKLQVVGHSIGGFLPGFAAEAASLHRILAVGAQYAYWPDYAPDKRLGMFFRWHILMPALTAICGYFPGRRLGWLEDLPTGVANEWSFRKARMEMNYPANDRSEVLAHFAAVEADILSITTDVDEYATLPAVSRGLSYYTSANRTLVQLGSDDLPDGPRGHFALFHANHTQDFWARTLQWLDDGTNPWPERVVSQAPAQGHSGV